MSTGKKAACPGRGADNDGSRDGGLLDFYRGHLERVIMPFWMERALDRRHGGYWTCFDNTGRELKSRDKFTWAQGRLTWVMARLAEEYPQDRRYLEAARSGADFLCGHAFLPEGKCAFLLTETGCPKEAFPGAGHDISIYADCFVVMGLARYAAVAGEAQVLERAVSLYDSVNARLEAGLFRTEPYPVPRGYKAHGVPMIALNTGQELAAALGRRGDARRGAVAARNKAYADEIMGAFAHGGRLLEMVGEDNRPVDSLLGNYINPGHTIEDAWFIIHQALENGDRARVEKAARLMATAFELGWDREHGGIFQYVGREGGPPSGSVAGLEGEAMVEKLRHNWDSKLWWPHSEALYAFLLAWRLTGDDVFRDYHDRVFDYTFRTFPNPDREVGEWIQIRDRRGRPEQKVTALPVKDPYHVARNLVFLVELLSGRFPGAGPAGRENAATRTRDGESSPGSKR